MSLIITAIFEHGTILACDPFVFDNDGDYPARHLDFGKLHISERYGCVLTAVGSRWVFRECCTWLDGYNCAVDQIQDAMALKWSELNSEWKEKRNAELCETESGTLRPLSDSLLIMTHKTLPRTITIIEPEGTIHESSTYVVTGSGCYLVEQFFNESGRCFSPTDTLEISMALVEECFTVAGHDLYVVGVPTMAVVTENCIIDLSDKCGQYWQGAMKRYYGQVNKALRRSIKGV